MAFACFCSYFCFAFAIAKAETSKAKFESQARRNGESPLQHDEGMAPKCPESHFKAKSKASCHDRHLLACLLFLAFAPAFALLLRLLKLKHRKPNAKDKPHTQRGIASPA